MAGVSRYLARGQPVVLATLEAGGRTVRPVRDRIDLGRRLARAVAGDPAGPAVGAASGRAGPDRGRPRDGGIGRDPVAAGGPGQPTGPARALGATSGWPRRPR